MTTTAETGLQAKPPAARPLIALLPLLWLVGSMGWWGLAFPPLPSEPPEWLAAVQAVCFGNRPGELPAPYGWGALIVSPLAMLAALVVGWGGEIREGWAVWGRLPWGRAVAMLAGMAVVIQAGWVTWSIGARLLSPADPWQPVASGPMPPDYSRLNRAAPSFTLRNQHGEQISLGKFRGKVIFLTFAFGHCTTVCPTVLKNVEAAVKRSGSLEPEVVVISLDAWRDTPSVLAGIMRKWNLPPTMHLLSGSPWEVNEVLDALNVGRRRDERTGQIDHAALVYVLDAQGSLAYGLLNPTVGWLVEAARRAAQPSF